MVGRRGARQGTDELEQRQQRDGPGRVRVLEQGGRGVGGGAVGQGRGRLWGTC